MYTIVYYYCMKSLSTNATHYSALTVLAKAAKELGKKDEAKKFNKLYKYKYFEAKVNPGDPVGAIAA